LKSILLNKHQKAMSKLTKLNFLDSETSSEEEEEEDKMETDSE
jgi:hypothetical protein